MYHLARLGLDAYRIHVWDREISDAAGNLVVNDHLRAFDYLLAELKARGFKIVLTPLQFGHAGYPEAVAAAAVEEDSPAEAQAAKRNKAISRIPGTFLRGSIEDHPLLIRWMTSVGSRYPFL